MFARIRFARIRKVRGASILLGLSCLLLSEGGRSAFAQLPVYTVTGWDLDGYADSATGDYTLGYNFTPTQNVTVTALGEWVSHSLSGGPSIINASETITMFDSVGNVLLTTPFTQASATLTGNTLPSGSEFRYVDITSLYSESARTLLAGQSYTVAATVGQNSYAAGWEGQAINPLINITSDGLLNGGDTLSGPNPTPPSYDAGTNMYGTSFEIAGDVTSSTPEPGSLTLFTGLAVSGGVFALRRRRRS